MSTPTHPSHVPPQAAAVPAAAPQHWLARAVGVLPTLLVFALLAGIFYVGHHTGWKLPKLAELRGAVPPQTADWCEEHQVAESECLECQAALKPKLPTFGWCRLHGVAECVICHPELAQTREPPPPPAYDTAAAIALRPRPTNNSVSTLHTKVVQLASAEALAKAGIEVDPVTTGPIREEIVAPGEVVFDPTRVAQLASRLPGTVWRVLKQVGQPVAKGEPLALVEAAEVGQAKANLLQAVAERQTKAARHQRLKSLSDVAAARMIVEAEAELRAAEIKVLAAEQVLVNLGLPLPPEAANQDPQQLAETIRFLGIPTDLAASIRGETQTANLIPLVAPISGVLVTASVVSGEVISTSTAAFKVADLRRMLLNLNVRQEDAPLVQPGQRVLFEADDGLSRAHGAVDWISPTIDHKSRTLPVRVYLAAEERRLRDNTFGVGRIVLREEPQAIVVPRSAVHNAGDVHVIFVRDKRFFEAGAPKFFHVRQVRLGAQQGEQVELLAGALPGEVVATHGSGVLLAQLLRSKFGSGEGHGHHH